MEPEQVTDTPPRPAGRTVFTQGWRDVTFLHWAVDPALVAPLLPAGTRPDVLDGATYVGLIPFRMRRIGVLGAPGLPWAGSFAETNVRLYSTDDAGRRGVVFRSLDADRLLPAGWPACPTAGRRCGCAATATWSPTPPAGAGPARVGPAGGSSSGWGTGWPTPVPWPVS